MWGIIPAAGAGSRIQPLAFSKELLPVGDRAANGRERPRAVSEYLVERMIRGGADKLCFIIAPHKTDILEYYGTRAWGAEIAYVAQARPSGLCDALFRAAPKPVPRRKTVTPAITGDIPNPIDRPRGCHFHPRCPFVMDVCRDEYPAPRSPVPSRMVKCHLY